MAAAGEPKFRARQIYRWLYARRADDLGAMTDLPLALRETLAARYRLGLPAIEQVVRSEDGTRKYLLGTPGGGAAEAVFIPDDRRVTFCISPQIGCALDCRFCHTATIGLVRNLSAGEIVGQALTLLTDNRERIAERHVNVVMMGMGEALHNYDASIAAVRLLADPSGVGLPRRRITLSTAGLVPAILKLAGEPVRPRLAISLNATTDEVRTRIMPINRRHPIGELMAACARFPLAPGERLTFEYVLLAGVNDAPADPPRLAALLNRHQLKAKVNLIPFNQGSGLPYQEPSADLVRQFRDDLLSLGVPVSVRRNRGRDIAAACGQLALAGRPLQGD